MLRRFPSLLRLQLRLPSARLLSASPKLSTAALTNLRISHDSEGNEIKELVFASEPIGMPAEDGHGWVQLEFEEYVGSSNRYKVVRKLGWGSHSSTWLARDTKQQSFVAIKFLTGHHTEMSLKGVVWEAEALRLLSALPPMAHCTPLLDEFTLPGKGSSGNHTCFVFPLYGGDVATLQNVRSTPLRFQLAKRILLHTLRGLAHAHERGIVHTDLKHDNIFYSTSKSNADIETWLATDPSRRHDPEVCVDGTLQSAVSQPLPLISDEEALKATFVLGDYGVAQPSRLHPNRLITSLPLRAPEVYLAADWDTPADIWSFGCLVYEIVTGKHLFHYQTNEELGLTEEENMLYQMMQTLGLDFGGAQLAKAPRAIEFFTEDCSLIKDPPLTPWSILAQFASLRQLPVPEVKQVAALAQRCLQLDPEERPTARELLDDAFFDDVE